MLSWCFFSAETLQAGWGEQCFLRQGAVCPHTVSAWQAKNQSLSLMWPAWDVEPLWDVLPALNWGFPSGRRVFTGICHSSRLKWLPVLPSLNVLNCQFYTVCRKHFCDRAEHACHHFAKQLRILSEVFIDCWSRVEKLYLSIDCWAALERWLSASPFNSLP